MIRRLLFSVAILLALTSPLCAQRSESTLSDAEVEQLREAAYIPSDRILVFIKILDSRNKAIQDLVAKPRRPGREEDFHDLIEQFTAITDELNDNLDDYGPHHKDIRKSLPKLLEATERWASNMKALPEIERINVSRKLALESIRDVREEATKLVEDQKTWFLAHPPPKENKDAPRQ